MPIDLNDYPPVEVYYVNEESKLTRGIVQATEIVFEGEDMFVSFKSSSGSGAMLQTRVPNSKTLFLYQGKLVAESNKQYGCNDAYDLTLHQSIDVKPSEIAARILSRPKQTIVQENSHT